MPKHRKDKTDQDRPKGMSRYAAKIARRKKLAQKLGVPDAPLPVLLSSEAPTDIEEDSETEAQPET